MAKTLTICGLTVLFGVMPFVSGCVTPQTAPVFGGLVTDQVKGPVAGVDNSVNPTKKGTAQAKAIVCFATGDASITAAMKNGNITKVHHVDSEVFSVLGVYARYTRVVYGE